MLAMNPLMCNWIDMAATEIHPATMRITDAMQKWPGSEEPNQTVRSPCIFVLLLRNIADPSPSQGYSLANNTKDSAFTHMAKFPGRSERFLNAMTLFSKGPENSPKWLLENYPWNHVSSGKIVDVGGSGGEYSIPIMEAFPGMECVVQDLPQVIAEAPSLSQDLKERVSFMAHDFFTEQPVKGADVYLMRWILHD